MDIITAKQRLDELEMQMYAYMHALSIVSLDAETAAPAESHEGRGVALGILSGELYKLSTSKELSEIVEYIYTHKEEADAELYRRAELLREDIRKTSLIPMDEYTAYQELLNTAAYTWGKAKRANDYESYKPYLEKIVESVKRFAGYTDADKHPYDAQLHAFEEGTDRAYYDAFFGEVKQTLVPLIAKIRELPQPDDSWLHVSYPIEQQRKLSKVLMDVMGIDPNHCTLAEIEHPCTGGPNCYDVRMTTHYYENDPMSSVYSVIHEGGHATYELNGNPAYNYNTLHGGASTALHESQSRFYENYIGRSREFINWLWPRFCELFPEQTAGHTAEEMYRCVNKAVPGLIRIEADELTYSMHILIRYELEKRMMEGTVTADELPDEWNRLYKEYLGVDVPDNARGILQDVHWSEAYIGYFPTYSLGTAYSAQILETMKTELDFAALVEAGNLAPIVGWLREKLYRHCRMIKPGDVLPTLTGKPFDAKYYTEYLTKKYSDLYGI